VFVGLLEVPLEMTGKEGHDSISLEAEVRLRLTLVIVYQVLLCSVPATMASISFSVNRKHQPPQKPLSPLLTAGAMQDSLKKVNTGCGQAWQQQLSRAASRPSAR